MRDLKAIIHPTHPQVAVALDDVSSEVHQSLDALYLSLLTGEKGVDTVANQILEKIAELPSGFEILRLAKTSQSLAGWATGAFADVVAQMHTEKSEDGSAHSADMGEELILLEGALAGTKVAESVFGDKDCTDFFLKYLENESLKDILEYVGRLSDVFKSFKKRELERGLAPHDVETGGDINAILKSGLSTLASDDEFLELLFFERLINKTHLQWDRKDLSPKGKGDFTIMLDRSYSMNQGDRMKIAKGIALVLCTNALKEGRKVRLHAFNASNNCFEWTHKNQLDDMMQTILKIHADGGSRLSDTIVDELVKCKNKIQDVVLITDGEVTVDQLRLRQYCDKLDEDAANSFIVSLNYRIPTSSDISRLVKRSDYLTINSLDESFPKFEAIAKKMVLK